MNYRQIILKTIKGEPVDHIPFVPRLDIWYASNKIKGTLPKKYKGYTLRELSKDLGGGFHSVVPDFRKFSGKRSIALQGLGIYDIKSNPYKITLNSTDFNFKTDSEGKTTTIFSTPYGKVTTETLYNRKMESDGATLGHTIKHAIDSGNDLKAVGYIFENISVEDNYKNFKDYKEYTGDEGVCVAFGMLSASPMHHVMKELMSFEKFVYELNDNKKGLLDLAERISIFFEKVMSISLDSLSDIVFLGANYDNFLTWPSFFKQYITPYLKKYSDQVHKKGKYLLTHADGENEGLIQEYLNADIDIADSICPYPMTKLHLKDIRKRFGDNITIWGGLPSICVLEESINDNEFDRYINDFFEDLGEGKNIILSFADTTPPGAKFDRIEKVAKMALDFSI